MGSVPLFVAIFCVILTMYGGGFATIPAYLADLFGTQFVGAIHGRLLTAWSTAGVLGPVLVNYIREYQISHGVPAAEAYNVTMYMLAGLLRDRLRPVILLRPGGTKVLPSERRAGQRRTRGRRATTDKVTRSTSASWCKRAGSSSDSGGSGLVGSGSPMAGVFWMTLKKVSLLSANSSAAPELVTTPCPGAGA